MSSAPKPRHSLTSRKGKRNTVTTPLGEGTSFGTIHKFLEALKTISHEIEPEKVAENIISQTSCVLGCDRVSVFYVDDITDELILLIAKGSVSIRLPIGSGIAGTVAMTGRTLNISDAYSDPRFNSSADAETGYKTKTILATALRDYDGEIVGVIQAINKHGDEPFSSNDEILFENLAAHAGVALRNAEVYKEAVRSEQRMQSLMEIVQFLHSDPNVHSLIFTLNRRANELCDADKATFYLVDSSAEELTTFQGDLNIRFSWNKGIAGYVARTGQDLNVSNAYDDERFNKEFDEKTGYTTKAILCMPVFDHDKNVVGVMQLINKEGEGVFDDGDEEIIRSLLAIAGPLIAKSHTAQNFIYKTASKSPEEEAVRPRHVRQSSMDKMGAITE